MAVPNPQQSNQALNVWPTSYAELKHAERLVVWAFRYSACALANRTGHHVCLLHNEFARQFGHGDGQAALCGMLTIVRTLREDIRRDLHLHQPACQCLTAEEACLICLIGSCQRGQAKQARFLAEWLVSEDSVGDLIGGAVRLGREMSKHALHLPRRARQTGATGGAPTTVH